MAVVDVVTPDGHLGVTGEGYRPTGTITGPATARTLAVGISQAALDCVHGAAVEALDACRRADIRVAMITGDHPSTAEAIARDIGLLGPGGVVLSAADLPTDDEELGALLDRPDGAVVARVTPADKFRIARVLRDRGHVVAMTGDGVNDAPAMREADVGVAMGASGATSRASPPTSSSSTITSARSSPRSSWGGPRSRTSSAS